MEKKSYLEYSQAIRNILKNSLELYQRGETAFYRVMAAQLRILLCDSTRRHARVCDISLLPLLIPDLKLPVPPALDLEPGSLPLNEWLDLELKIAEATINIRQLVRRVCDQDGGAHVDPKPKTGLPESEKVQEWIVSLSQIVLQILEEQGQMR